MRNALGLGLCLALAACAHTEKRQLFETTVPLPDGRFVGPIEVEVPRRPTDSLSDYIIVAELESRCGPLLQLSYQDGERGRVGSRNGRWQELLAARAKGAPEEVEAPAPVNRDLPVNSEPAVEGVPVYDEPDASVEVPAPVDPYAAAPTPVDPYAPPAPTYTPPASQAPSQASTGSWIKTTVEDWPGQLEFMSMKDTRCGARKVYRSRYVTAYDESGRIKVWAEVPQELEGAKLHIKLIELIDHDRIEERREGALAKERRAKRREKRLAERERKRQRRADKRAARAEKRYQNRPPMPEPKNETPAPAKAEGATWSAGYWAWEGARGKWVWVRGHWLAPASAPGPLRTSGGVAPVVGCTWVQGHWVWVPGDGSWRWQEGHWNAPPPKQEARPPQPVPESPWVDGRWIAEGKSFKWIAGYWGRPTPRQETPPPPPRAGAEWISGSWLLLRGTWHWSPGYYAGSHKAPPPRKRETPGAKPHAQAVWLAGYWQWLSQASRYEWIAGHWESPPGEDYEWIPDPPRPEVGYSVSGQWKLRIDVRPAPTTIEVRP